MFTGSIEHVGRVEAVETLPDLTRFRIDLGPIAEGVGLGASISVSGCCLTVTSIDGSVLSFDAIAETLEKTRVGALREGEGVNLERAMGAGARFDGHIVQGHVDGTGIVTSVSTDAEGTVVQVDAGSDLMRYVVEKGSIAVDGISLTVADVTPTSFSIAIIPHTHAVTAMGRRRVGDTVNVEADVLAKYVERLVRPSQQ